MNGEMKLRMDPKTLRRVESCCFVGFSPPKDHNITMIPNTHGRIKHR